MARKPFVDPNPNLPRRRFYAEPQIAESYAIHFETKRTVKQIEARALPVDKKARNSAAVARVPKMIEGPKDSNLGGKKDSNLIIRRGPQSGETTKVVLSIPVEWLERVDALRGDKSRAEALRLLLAKALDR